MTVRPIDGAFDQPDRLSRRGASPELYPLPSQSLAEATLEIPDPSDSFRDTIVLVALAIFLSLIAVFLGIVGAVLKAWFA